jgi:hypothetical protein
MKLDMTGIGGSILAKTERVIEPVAILESCVEMRWVLR